MTGSDKRTRTAAALIIAAMGVVPVGVLAQGSAIGAATRVLPPPPTGSVSALTKAASAVRASRAAALAPRGATAAGNGLVRSTQQVMGYLWTANNGAITDATVQLKNTVTGEILQRTATNSAGEFLFQNVDAGEYVIEYVSGSTSRLVALGHPFTVSPGETVATFVRLSNGLPMLLPNELTNNVAQQAVASAAKQGVPTIAKPFITIIPPYTPPPTDDPPPPPPPVASAIR